MADDKLHKYSPECPFCGRHIGRPAVTKTEFGEILSGHCGCGTIYVCDPTGHNAGEAYMEALALAKGDWNIGVLDPEVDYKTADVDYDLKTHTRVYSGHRGEITGKLIFVRPESEKVGSRGQERPVEQETRKDQGSREKGGAKVKKMIKEHLESGSSDEIVKMSLQNNAVIRILVSLAYDKESMTTWKAIETMGAIARGASPEQMVVLRETIRRLIWSMTDESGGIGWSAPEMMGEIIRNNPGEFLDLVPILWSFREEELFTASVLWAMGRIADVRPDIVGFIREDLGVLLRDDNPEVRGYAAMVIGKLGDGESLRRLESLLQDTKTLKVYRNGELEETTVAGMVAEAINKHIK